MERSVFINHGIKISHQWDERWPEVEDKVPTEDTRMTKRTFGVLMKGLIMRRFS